MMVVNRLVDCWRHLVAAVAYGHDGPLLETPWDGDGGPKASHRCRPIQEGCSNPPRLLNPGGGWLMNR